MQIARVTTLKLHDFFSALGVIMNKRVRRFLCQFGENLKNVHNMKKKKLRKNAGCFKRKLYSNASKG